LIHPGSLEVQKIMSISPMLPEVSILPLYAHESRSPPQRDHSLFDTNLWQGEWLLSRERTGSTNLLSRGQARESDVEPRRHYDGTSSEKSRKYPRI
jgi:hypothetical protein